MQLNLYVNFEELIFNYHDNYEEYNIIQANITSIDTVHWYCFTMGYAVN